MQLLATGLRRLLRLLWLASALLIIGSAVLVVIGRQSISGIDKLRPEIQQFISDRAGLPVQLGELHGKWTGIVPALAFSELRIIAPDGRTAFYARGGHADVDIWNSLRRGNLIWRELTLQSLELTVSEDADGKWHVRGFNGGDSADPRLILEPLAYSHLLRLDHVTASFEVYHGSPLQVRGQDLLVENDHDFHRASASISLSEQESAADLLFEGRGDPMDLATFSADGYLKLSDLNISDPLAGLLKTVLPELFSNLSQFRANANGEIWVDLHPGGGLDFEGNLSIGEIPLEWLVDVPPVRNIHTQLTGWFTPGQDWGARLQQFTLNWNGEQIDPLNLVFTQKLGARRNEYDISLNHLDVTLLTEMLRKTRIPSDKLFEIIDNLQPSGDVHALTLGHNSYGYYASALLENASIKSWHGVPGLRGVDGYAEFNSKGGMFQLADNNGLGLYFPQAYEDYLELQSGAGRVALLWDADAGELRIRGGPLKGTTEAGSATVFFSVKQDVPSKGLPPEINLVIGARDLDARYRNEFLPYVIPDNLLQWLQTSISRGHVNQFGLIYRNQPPAHDEKSRTLQLLFDVDNGALRYHPDWPGISDLQGVVLVDDMHVDADVESGTVENIALEKATVLFEGEAESSLLTVDGQVHGAVAQVMKVLSSSPLRSSLGPLPDWRFAGTASGRLHLEVPMGGGNPADIGVDVQALVEDGEIEIPETPLKITSLRGPVGYATGKGLFGEGINGRLWKKPLTAVIRKSDSEQQILIDGSVASESLRKWFDFPWEKIIQGKMPVKATIGIPDVAADKARAVTVAISSSMRGAAIDLPAPLGKSATESRPLKLDIELGDGWKRIHGMLGDKLEFKSIIDTDGKQSAALSFDRSVDVPEDREFLFAAWLPTVEISAWEPLLDLIRSNQSTAMGWRPRFDLSLDYLQLGGLRLSALNARGTIDDSIATIDLTGDVAEGRIRIPIGSALIPDIHLTRLQIPGETLREQVVEGDVDPRNFIAMDVAVDNLFVGEKRWGSVAARIRPEPGGVLLGNIRGNLFGLLPGAVEDAPDTEFFWHFDGQQHSSRLVGPMGLANVGDVFSALDLPVIVDSKSGRLEFDLRWQGKPWEVSRELLSGDFKIALREGSFYKTPVAANAALRLVSLINFANWLRRLKLDFSDVFGENLAFNSLDGAIHFDQGVASLNDPLRVILPSGRMSMKGKVDLVDERVDLRFVATLPVATNLPWVVALFGGLPAAAGVYLTSKLVEKQVNRLSSISYKLKGPLDDIKVEVDKIFAADLDARDDAK